MLLSSALRRDTPHMSLAAAGFPRALARAPARLRLARRAVRPARASASPTPTPARAAITIRRGAPQDVPAIRQAVLAERMNPLGLDPERFVVAVDDASGAVVGFGQLKPWETLSDRPADDLVGVVVRGLGLTPNWSGRLLELASVVVSEPRRGEGIGRMIVDRLVAEAYESGAQEGAHGGAQEVTLCLLTLRESAGFYEGSGFRLVDDDDDVPRPLQAERAVGNVVARMVADDECVCMIHRGERGA